MKVDHWGVDVRINHDKVLTIESEFISGIEDIGKYEETIRDIAHNLLAFIGGGDDVKFVRELSDREQVKPFFEDGNLVVGWRDSKEILVRIGANTPANRALAQVVARAIRTC